MPAARSIEQVRGVVALERVGTSDRAISERTGVPLNTIRTWRSRGLSKSALRELGMADMCTRCGGEVHDFTRLPTESYAYLLGLYLGDGCIFANGRSCYLRVTLDAAYPAIVESCRAAIAVIKQSELPWKGGHHSGGDCVNVTSYWKQWPCLFPQHGAGKKHHRKIELTHWQREIVRHCPEQLLRGLIHSDGWRGLNRVFVKGRWYAYPRYQFSNRSDDIRRTFTDACDLLGVEWRPWGPFHISVARRASVAKLDEFIGPKA